MWNAIVIFSWNVLASDVETNVESSLSTDTNFLSRVRVVSEVPQHWKWPLALPCFLVLFSLLMCNVWELGERS